MKELVVVLLVVSCKFLVAQEYTYSSSDIKETHTSKTIFNTDKAAGDTLWYEDFGGGFVPNGWISTDFTTNGFDWIYTATAPSGQYSTNTAIVGSSTAANGFASLPADFYNTPTPVNGFVSMDAYLTSGPIVISPKRSVKLRWQQAFRYCCNADTNKLEVEVSSDKLNWTSFNAKPNVGPNTVFNGAIEVDITSVAANQDTIYIRFYQSASHYYWMVDDIAVLEGYNNAVVIDKVVLSDGAGRFEYYTKIPKGMSTPLQITADVSNKGGEPVSNLTLDLTVLKDNSPVFSMSSSPIDTLRLDSAAVISSAIYTNQDGIGKYDLIYSLSSDSTNELFDQDTISYEITDSVYAKDLGVTRSSVGTGGFGTPTDDGIIGTRFYLDSTNLLTSVSYFISTSTLNVGVGVKAQVWGFDTSQISINDMIGVPGNKYESKEYTLDSSNVGTWLDFKVDPPMLLPTGQYVLALKQTFGDSINHEVGIGRAFNVEKYHPTNFEFGTFLNTIYSGNPTWGWIAAQPMMRMHFGQNNVGIKTRVENEVNFQVFPNPTNGIVQVNFSENSKVKQLEVINNLGQTMFAGQLLPNESTHNIDLSHLEKGIYFMVLKSDKGRGVQKVILK
jgi:hypothetical protein